MRTGIHLLLMVFLAAGASAAAAQESTSAEDREILEQAGQDEGTRSAPRRDEADEDDSTTYSAIGVMRVDPGFSNTTEAINLDITLLGIRLPRVKWFAVELNLGITFIPGEVEESSGGTNCDALDEFLGTCSPSGATANADNFGINTFGAYAVFRTPTKVYGMGKLGYRYLDSNIEQIQQDRTGTGWGLGLGYRYNTWGGIAELQWMHLSADVTGIGLSVTHGYGGR